MTANLIRLRRNLLRVAVVLALLCFSAFRYMDPAVAEYAEIEGSGSTWAYTIVQQWVADVAASGMQITFNNNGSSQGRKDFSNYVTDFADSDIPYQGQDPVTHQTDASSRPYAYLPVVAGGTALTYQLHVAGKLVNNLRLSGETIAKIFTNKITNWNDPEIAKENGGRAFPSLPITPVVRSDGSGATAQFTLWMGKQYPSIWGPYNGGHTGLTSIYPRTGRQIAAAGDDGIMNTVDSAAGNGDIGYTEYSYPLNAHYPVVYVENPDGYFVQPTQYNVAVALTKARINGCKADGSCDPAGLDANTYLTQNLDEVYTFKDPRSYPISSYSYMIIPTSSTDQRMTPAKRQTLADFLSYSLCTGQSKAGPYGYSPLPLNLVKASFTQIEKLGPQADPSPVKGVNIKNPSANLASCDNPTFVKGNLAANHLAQVAPLPLACQKVSATPCGDGAVAPGTTTKGGSGQTSSRSPGAKSGDASTAGASGSAPSEPVTGGDSAEPGSAGSSGTTDLAGITPTAVELSAQRDGSNKLFGVVAVVELAAIVLIPGLYVAWLRRRKDAA
ncbi:MAG TPA: phosphate ABC transporter substrate-binding protein PstS [Mycobacteriales bacterium]|nr:phosphate ABC transporter substrate-binding protein PstS [Mycobacteriales bacterium]